MKCKMIILTLILISMISCSNENNKLNKEKTVEKHFESLVKGKLNECNKMIDVPYNTFTHGVGVLYTINEVEEYYRESIKSRKLRRVPKYIMSIPNNYKKLDKNLFNAYEVVRLTIAEGKFRGTETDFYLKKKDREYKIIGIF